MSLTSLNPATAFAGMEDWAKALQEASLPYVEAKVQWGTLDCMQLLREYYRLRTGLDVGGGLAYTNEQEADALKQEAGGLVSLVTKVIGTDPLEESDPEPGDVCVVSIEVAGSETLSGGIYTGYCVFCVDPLVGLARARPDQIVAAWSV